MDAWWVALVLIGFSSLVAVVLLSMCRFFGACNWFRAWIFGTKEETVQLTKAAHFTADGYAMSSESDVDIRVSGQYTHFDMVNSDVKFLNELRTSAVVELQPPPADRRRFSMPPAPTSTGITPLAPPPGSKRRRMSFGGDNGDLPDVLSMDSSRLQRTTSCDSVSSDTSVVLEALESPNINGELDVGLEYDHDTEDLIVTILKGRDLVGPDPSVPVDSYIRLYLLPDKSTNIQTRVHKRDNCPQYKERFLFGVDRRELGQRSLLFCVYMEDKFGSGSIGEAEIKLIELDLSHPTTLTIPVIDSALKPTDLGEMMFSLSYLPTAERLTVVVVKARNLKNYSPNFSPFVKVYLVQNGKKISKKKTSIKRCDVNPIFNEAMIFSVPANNLKLIQLRITVADYQGEGKTTSVGHVIVGSQCTGKSLSHWTQMMSSLRKPIAMWHPLRN
ncbi:synaptotagmin-12-like [Ornithodoros turicata]|uniref:synaptotagmin-12-like n=1 Tax=Ornithodoros turicata TaxID=34597 RepID=UPI0031391A45